MDKPWYVRWVRERGVRDLQSLLRYIESLVQRCGVVALGKPDLEERECSGTAGMMRAVRRNDLCNVLVDDVGEHGVYRSEVMQRASCVVKLSLVMFSESNLQRREINGLFIRSGGGHVYRIVFDVWVFENL